MSNTTPAGSEERAQLLCTLGSKSHKLSSYLNHFLGKGGSVEGNVPLKYAHTNKHTHTYIQTQIRTHKYTYTHKHKYTHTHTHARARTHARTRALSRSRSRSLSRSLSRFMRYELTQYTYMYDNNFDLIHM